MTGPLPDRPTRPPLLNRFMGAQAARPSPRDRDALSRAAAHTVIVRIHLDDATP